MDIVAACRVLVAIEERGSVTRAAAALDVAQSVASRRLIALERHLGGPVLERTARRATLTPFGRDLVPSARRLVRLADELEVDADRARLRPLTIAVPTTCSTRDLAVADAAARAGGMLLDFRQEVPSRRAELATSLAVRVALVAVPREDAQWTARLGAAGRRPSDRPLRVDGLRPRRSGAGVTIRTGPEDDVPHVRDVLVRAATAAGVLPGQLPVDQSVTAALASVLTGDDLLLCTASEADELGLHWRPFDDVDLVRGAALVGDSDHDVRTVAGTVGDELAAAMGMEDVRV